MIPQAKRWKGQLLARALEPYPLQSLARETIRRRQIGTYAWRVDKGAGDRPAYAYGVREAAKLAQRLGLPAVSVVEFGVAGGNGLLALEHHARRWASLLGITIEVYGFDTGRGLPGPTDYRDLPYHWKSGFFAMDVEALRGRLQTAELIIGDIGETLSLFTATYDPAPIGAVMHDMDLYSSTVTGLQLFDCDERHRLPRIVTYLDDIIGDDVSLYRDFTGERLAIAEFNAVHPSQKISPAYHLSCRAVDQWHHQIYIAHDFAHSRYCEFVSTPEQQLPLSGR